MQKVFCLGSINTDFVISVPRMPLKGESMKGSGFLCGQGGKGANQAAACKKLGCGTVRFIGAVGTDSFGDELLRALNGCGVDTAGVRRVDGVGSGACIILLDESEGDNRLIVDLGANLCVDEATLRACLREAGPGDVFVTQLEVNPDAVQAGLTLAKQKGMFTVLNPAPAAPLPEEIYGTIDLVVLNETEALLLTGVSVTDAESAEKSAACFLHRGVREVVITAGRDGCYYCDGDHVIHRAADDAERVDPTSAGDTFIGALISKKVRGISVVDALDFASAASAITVSRKGAQVSIPTLAEVEERLARGV